MKARFTDDYRIEIVAESPEEDYALENWFNLNEGAYNLDGGARIALSRDSETLRYTLVLARHEQISNSVKRFKEDQDK